ncbi:MAG TPA: hypothetical protein PK869_00900, partial [Candidatus Hydrogenedentes bacterium]|nr:hypothetical protein [Candidatus Hydrogenedentota bacterium]
MNRFRAYAGVSALLALGLTLNILAIQRDIFQSAVYIPFGVSLALALVWFVLTFITKASAAKEQRRMGSFNGIIASITFLAICSVTYAFFRRWDRSWDLTEEGRTAMAPQTV